MWRVLGLALVVGCYQPALPLGLRCGPNLVCPTDQTCDYRQNPPICVDHLVDAAIDAPQLTFSGIIITSGGIPIPGARVDLHLISDDINPVASAIADSVGGISLTVTSPFDGYAKISASSYVYTYWYPPRVVTENIDGGEIPLATSQLLDTIAMGAAVTQAPTNGLIVMGVAGKTSPVAGATVSSAPASGDYRYPDSGMIIIPSSTATMTSANGIGWMFNAPPAPQTVRVDAYKLGLSFLGHNVKARANSLTITVVEEI